LARDLRPNARVTAREQLIYRRRMRALRWSQSFAASVVGVTASIFSRWLRGLFVSLTIRETLDRALVTAEEAQARGEFLPAPARGPHARR